MISSVSVWLLQEPALANSVPDLAPAGTPMLAGVLPIGLAMAKQPWEVPDPAEHR
jgi:hypothetical protein